MTTLLHITTGTTGRLLYYIVITTSLRVKNTPPRRPILISVLQIDYVFISLGHLSITDWRFSSGNCVVCRDDPIRPIAHDYNSIGNDNKTPTGVQVGCEGGRVSPAPPVLFVHRVNKNHNIGNNNNNITSEHGNIYCFYFIVTLRWYIFYFTVGRDRDGVESRYGFR